MLDQWTRRRRRRSAGGGGGGVAADYIITSDAEWASTMALGAATLSGKIAEVRGALGSVSMSGLDMASALTIRGGPGGSVRRIALSGTVSRVTFDSMAFRMTGWPKTENEMFFWGTGAYEDFQFINCTARHGYGPSLVDIDVTANYPEYARVDNVGTATTTSSRISLSYENAAITAGTIYFFNRGTQTVYAKAGNSSVTASAADLAIAAGAYETIAVNPTTDTHIAVISASGSVEYNARTEIGFVRYLSRFFAFSGGATLQNIRIDGCTVTDVVDAIKGIPRVQNQGVFIDNTMRRIGADRIAISKAPSASVYFFRNLMEADFSRSGIAENLSGDAGDPHGDYIQLFGDGGGTIENVFSAGNRTLRPTFRSTAIGTQGLFWSDNDAATSFRNCFSISDLMLTGSPNGMAFGETSFPVDAIMVYGATIVHGADYTTDTRINLKQGVTGHSYIGKSLVPSLLLDNTVIQEDITLLTGSDPSVFFADFSAIPTATTKAQVEAALTAVGAAAGLGAVATANTFDATTKDHTAVIQWQNIPSGAGWDDLTGQAINTVITLPLRKILNRRAAQTVVPGTGVEWRSVATDGTTEVQAWTTSSGTIEPDQFIQIRRTSSASGLTALDFDVTINGFLQRTAVTTQAAAPSVFHTQSGTGPYFVDPSNIPASTTIMEWDANIYLPSYPGGNVKLFGASGVSCDLEISSAGALRATVKDGAGSNRITPGTGGTSASGAVATGVWSRVQMTADQVAGTLNVSVNGTNVLSVALSASANQAFQTSRLIAFYATSAGASPLHAGVQIEYGECYFTTSGVRSLRKRVAGNAATVNADGWKIGTDAT